MRVSASSPGSLMHLPQFPGPSHFHLRAMARADRQPVVSPSRASDSAAFLRTQPIFVFERTDQRLDAPVSPIFPSASAAWRRTIQLLPIRPSIRRLDGTHIPDLFQHARDIFSHHAVGQCLDQARHGSRIADSFQRPHGGRTNSAVTIFERSYQRLDSARILQLP